MPRGMTGPMPATGERLEDLRAAAVEAVEAYATAAFAEEEFVPGETVVPIAGRVVGRPELAALTEASLDGWLTEGRFAERFCEEFAGVVERSHVAMVGSGSQANQLAVAAGRSPLQARPLSPRDEVVTPAVGFPTTVNPLYHQGLVPVYVDVEPDTYNPSLAAIADAVGPRTRGIVVAHCLGNPIDAAGLATHCEENDLVLIEDCCDALGSTLGGQLVGTFGHVATYSFYAAHHMTTGEGGAIATDDPIWARAASSLREWGRDCWCPTGVSDICGARFDGKYGELPVGYDHKYVFSHLGFNFKVTDMQAALGLAQIARLDSFHAARRRNFARLDQALRPLEDRLVLPRTLPGADPSWFGYPVTLREGGSAERRALQLHLRERRIESRQLLGGNLLRQPGYVGLEHRVAGSLPNANAITERAFWVGTNPRLTDGMVDWIAQSISDFIVNP